MTPMHPLFSVRPLRRARSWGLIAGLAAMILWPAFSLAQDPVRPLYIAALAGTALCGVAILALTLLDLTLVRRGRSVLPARMFDLGLGLLLAVPSGAALVEILA